MCTAAKLTRERLIFGTDGNNAHDVTVLLTKQGDSTRSLRILDIHLDSDDRLGGKNLLVNKILDALKLLVAERLKVSEVETQVLGRNKRSGLGNVIA